jgi:hypothetical protein
LEADAMADKVASHYSESSNLAEAIAVRLRDAGNDIGALTTADLSSIDEFHVRGRKATLELAEGLNLTAAFRVLDVGRGASALGSAFCASWGAAAWRCWIGDAASASATSANGRAAA